MRRSSVLLVALLTACSSGTAKTALSGSPSPSELSPTPSASASPPASPSASRVQSSPSASSSPTSSPKASPTTSPKPRRTHGASPTPSPTATRKGSTFGISEVAGDRFSPSTLTLRVGDSVLVTDKDNLAPHTFTVPSLHIDSGGMNQGDTYRYRFLRAGTFDFICDYHKDVGMKGTVTVKP